MVGNWTKLLEKLSYLKNIEIKSNARNMTDFNAGLSNFIVMYRIVINDDI